MLRTEKKKSEMYNDSSKAKHKLKYKARITLLSKTETRSRSENGTMLYGVFSDFKGRVSLNYAQVTPDRSEIKSYTRCFLLV